VDDVGEVAGVPVQAVSSARAPSATGMERMVFLLVKGRETNERQYTTQASLADGGVASGVPVVVRADGDVFWRKLDWASRWCRLLARFLITNLAQAVLRTKNIFWGFMSDQARVEARLYACLLNRMSTFNRCFAGYVTEC
jgi:hypothetical protein